MKALRSPIGPKNGLYPPDSKFVFLTKKTSLKQKVSKGILNYPIECALIFHVKLCYLEFFISMYN